MTEHQQTLLDLNQWLVIIAAIPCTIFPFLYGFTSKWYLTYMGRSLMATKTSLALALDLTVYFQWHPNDLSLETQLWMAVGIYSGIAFALWFQLVSYLFLWKQTRRLQHTGSDRPRRDT